jgi:hypothetical protein
MNCVICNKILINRQKKYCSLKCHNQNGNNNYQVYKNQKKRGLERKIKLVTLLGAKCSCCSYNKNLAALHFHHLNPKIKESQLDMRKLSNSSWEWCLNEVSKCKLLCANCHSEEHFPSLNFLI